MKRLIINLMILSAFAAGSLISYAQREIDPIVLPAKPDTLSTPETQGPESPMPGSYSPTYHILPSELPYSAPTYSLPTIDWREGIQSAMPSWLYFSGGSQYLPGFMQIDRGSIGVSQTFGNFSVEAYAGGIKYGMFRSLNTSYFVGGQMSYRITSNLSVTIFGTYYTNAPYMGLAAYPYVETTNFGGYLSIDTSSRFGVDLGAKTYFDPFQRKFLTDPIVKPYFKVNEKLKIGIDLGPIIMDGFERINDKPSGPPPPPPQPPRLNRW